MKLENRLDPLKDSQVSHAITRGCSEDDSHECLLRAAPRNDLMKMQLLFEGVTRLLLENLLLLEKTRLVPTGMN